MFDGQTLVPAGFNTVVISGMTFASLSTELGNVQFQSNAHYTESLERRVNLVTIDGSSRGQVNTGETTRVSVDITIVLFNDPPVLSGSMDPVMYQEGQVLPVALFDGTMGLGLSDADDVNCSANVTLAPSFSSDILVVNGSATHPATVAADGLSVTIPEGPFADVLASIATIHFQGASDGSIAGENRTVTLTITDGYSQG